MRWLVRFYPAYWRRRYGSEFLAFLEEEGRLSPTQRLDLLRGLVDAHLTSLARRFTHRQHGTVRQFAGAGMGVLFTTSGSGGVIMRRQSLAVLFLLAGLALGLMVPFARQLVAARFSAPPPGYAGLIYQNSDVASWQDHDGLTTVDLVNTGRAIPRLVLVVPRKAGVGIMVQRDHKVILVHRFLHLGHGLVGYSLCPLATGQTATLYLSWPRPRTGHNLGVPDYALYGRPPHLVKLGRPAHPVWYDPQAGISDIRSLAHTFALH